MAKRRLARLPCAEETKTKIRAKLLGVPRPEAVRAAISAKLTGRKHTPEARERMRKAAKARHKDAKRAQAQRWRELDMRRITQWKADMITAHELGRKTKDLRLFFDVKQSAGWRAKRKMFDPQKRVSDGFAKPRS